MYAVHKRDRVVPITDIPQSAVGAGALIPIALGDEFITIVALFECVTKNYRIELYEGSARSAISEWLIYCAAPTASIDCLLQ